MKTGSGIIKPSFFGYKIGTRIKTRYAGRGNEFGDKLGIYYAKKGDKGIITGVSGHRTEILYDNGEYGYRAEPSAWENIKVTEEPKPEFNYEIY